MGSPQKNLKKITPNRKSVSVSTRNSISKDKTSEIQKELKDIKSKNKRQMMSELKKDGVIISGKSEQLLRDI